MRRGIFAALALVLIASSSQALVRTRLQMVAGQPHTLNTPVTISLGQLTATGGGNGTLPGLSDSILIGSMTATGGGRTSIASLTDSIMIGALTAYTPPRYWRILATSTNWSTAQGTTPQGFYEVQFYSSSDASGANLSIGATAEASSVQGGAYPISGANDGNTGTTWISSYPLNGSYQWWGVALATASAIHSVVIMPYGLNWLAQSYALQYSSDNSTWTTQSSFSTSNSPSIQTFTNL